MNKLEQFMKNNNLQNSEDIDSLVELADLTREQITNKQYSNINNIIKYTIENNYYEAFSWVVAILQEEFEKEECELKSFVCNIGRKIIKYDEFIERLQVDFNAIKNDNVNVYDENGEVQSFFNILTYKTKYQNIYLISSENFDAKDNDYIQYKIGFTRNEGKNR